MASYSAQEASFLPEIGGLGADSQGLDFRSMTMLSLV
jgi:hypothetical protein